MPVGAPAGGGWRARATAVSPPSGPAEVPGYGETAGRAATQGATAGFADEATGLLQATQDGATPWYLKSPVAALAEFTSDVPQAQKDAGAQVDRDRAATMTVGERLRRMLAEGRMSRDSERRQNAEAKAAHSTTYNAANILSGVPLAFALPGAGAKGALQGAGAGAVAGGLGGLGGSQADLTKGDVGGALWDTGVGATLGAALGAGASYLPKIAGAASRKGAELLERLGISQGRKVLTGGTKSISQAAAVSDDAVKRALEEGAIRPFGTTAGAAERLDVLREAAGAEYAQVVKALEDAGVVGPERDALAAQLFAKAREAAASNVGPVPAYIQGTAQKIARLSADARITGESTAAPQRMGEALRQALAPRQALPNAADVGELIARPARYASGDMGEVVERALDPLAQRAAGRTREALGPAVVGTAGEVGEVIGRPVERLGLTQAEGVKQSLQDLARAEYQKVGGNTLLGDAKMAAAADVRRAVEEAIQQQAGKAPEAAAAFIPVKQRTGELIQAATAAEKALNAAKNKNAVSLRDLLVAGAGKTPVEKLALLPLSMTARAVGPSTVAAGSYGAGKALGAAGEAVTPALSKYGYAPANLTAIQAMLDALRRKEENAP